MKKSLLKILAVLMLVCTVMPAAFTVVLADETAEIEGVSYEYKIVRKKSVTILKAITTENTLVIPDRIEGLPVTYIEKDAVDCAGMIALTIPDTVIKVKAGSFYNCQQTVELTLPGSCDAANGFMDLVNLKSLYISGKGAMYDYDNAFDVPWNDSVATIQNIYLSDRITHIGDHSFEGLQNVREFELPSHLESIGDYGCYNMISIHNWKLPDGLKTLGMSALGNDRMTQKASFYEMILPENLEYIGERALSRQARYYAYEGSLAAEFLRSEDMPFDEISFRLTEESISLKIGDEYQLEFVDAPIFLHRHVSYHSSNDKAVQVTADGHLRACGAGEATITADNGTAQTSLKVTVKSDGNIETHLLRLPAGVISYAINLSDFSGISGQAIRSVVSDSEILKVGSDYSLEALDQGSCYLTVKTDNKTVRYLVQIYKPLSTVSPVLDDFVMLKGTGFRLRYNVYPLDSDDPNVLFESADPSVVSVTSDGYLVAEGPGETTISLTPRGGYGPTGHATVKVVTTEMDLPVWAIPLMYGKQFRLYFPDKGNLKFYSSDDSVATVDESGMIVSRGMGDCFIAVYNEEKTQATWVDVRMYRAFSNGIDVSEWQDTLTLNDWLAIKNYGIDFAILRAGHGTGWKDVQFENNYAKAREAGVQLGVYHYVEATTVEEAQNEAYVMMEWLDGKRFEYPVIIDIEDSDQRGLSPELFSEIIIAYGSILAHGGYKVAVYSYASLLDSKCTDEVLALYDVWQAHWGTLKPSVFEKPYTMWQYTSDGTVAGINGRCDMDICFFDYPSYMKNNHLNGY